jgi:hypothetical protein
VTVETPPAFLGGLGEFVVREETRENFFSATLTSPIDAVVRAAELRRFLVNATNKRVQAKTGRSILLFHHSDANAPKKDIGSKPSSSPSQKVGEAARAA